MIGEPELPPEGSLRWKNSGSFCLSACLSSLHLFLAIFFTPPSRCWISMKFCFSCGSIPSVTTPQSLTAFDNRNDSKSKFELGSGVIVSSTESSNVPTGLVSSPNTTRLLGTCQGCVRQCLFVSAKDSVMRKMVQLVS